jgi:ubiquitin-like domain-containing CTD phosphatase 1
MQHVANKENLRKFTDDTTVFVMNEPRGNKPLLVLDLDHTLLDFSTKTIQTGGSVDSLKRPFMDQFLCNAYQHYDLVVWSQTSWRWLETKLIELGMLTHPGYKFCFVLDKTCMFSIISTKRDGSSFEHHVKPLQIIWSKFPRWGPHNTIHLDDLSRNFALNVASGLKVTAYFRKKSTSRRDAELVGIGKYLEILARANVNFDEVDFNQWMDVVSGKAALTSSASKGDTK